MDDNYKEKYLKYKAKYLDLKLALGKKTLTPEEIERNEEYKENKKGYEETIKQIKKILKKFRKQVPDVSNFKSDAKKELKQFLEYNEKQFGNEPSEPNRINLEASKKN